MNSESYRARGERRLREPHTGAVNWGKERLTRWLSEAAEGSVEEAVLAAIAAWPEHDEHVATSLGYFMHCEQAWGRVRAVFERDGCRRSEDVALQLPFPLSQAIVSLADSATMVPMFSDVRVDARGGRLVVEILESLPEEDARVRMKLGVIRAELLLCAGDPEGHLLFGSLAREHPHFWLPLERYFQVATDLRVEDALVWRRVARMIEDGLALPKADEDNGDGPWAPEEAIALALDFARGRPVLVPW